VRENRKPTEDVGEKERKTGKVVTRAKNEAKTRSSTPTVKDIVCRSLGRAVFHAVRKR